MAKQNDQSGKQNNSTSKTGNGSKPVIKGEHVALGYQQRKQPAAIPPKMESKPKTK